MKGKMKFYKDFQGSIEKDSHLYLHCRKCSGVFLYEGYPSNPIFGTVGCPYCGYLAYGNYFDKGISCKEWTEKYNHLIHRGKNGLEKAIINQNEFESAAIIRLASVVTKEGALVPMLKIVQKYKNGIHRKELEQIITSCGYGQKLIDQAVYFGLISQSNEVDSNNMSFYHLTEMGFKLLKACKNL